MNQGHTVPVSQPHFLRRDDNKEYRLVVEQQPVRARMCGFGDKDRRPITPPPCIRLVVIDRNTGLELDFNDIDSTYFVLMVDLWDEQCSVPVNLVRHSSAAPTVSISSSTVTSFPPAPERAHFVATPMPQYDPQSQYRQDQPRQPMAGQGMAPPAMTPQAMTPQAMTQYGQPPMPPTGWYPQPHGYPPTPQYAPNNYSLSQVQAVMQASPSSNNHTRNLIGMNAVNACRLNNLDGKPGFWFVLQDLSVRTEGTFRLKLYLFDIGAGNGTNGVVDRNGPTNGKGPCLCFNFSDVFQVYSAKKFPGVIESTPLSKCFAQQGIKIPIRKDGPKPPNQSEFDDGD
jgi:hypothetical protein